jgi:hypothetical protein
MRLLVPRATALFALLLAALVAAGAVMSARTGPPGRDRAVRVTRAGAQRLDSPDGPVHGHEESDPLQASAADVIGLTLDQGDGPSVARGNPSPSTSSLAPASDSRRHAALAEFAAATLSPEFIGSFARPTAGRRAITSVWRPAAGRAPPAI